MTEEEERRVGAFLALSRLEQGLRRFLTAELERLKGRNWEKALPPDVREKVQNVGLQASDFPDLKKILASNWNHLEIPSSLRKSTMLAHLEGLEPIRNAIAHSREIADGDLSMAQAALYVFRPLLGDQVPLPQPPTSYRGVALSRISMALKFEEEVSDTDLDILSIDSDFATARGSVESYRRVRSRPGRQQSLLEGTRREAQDAISKLASERGDDAAQSV